MKCDKCGYDDKGTGDFAHICGPVARVREGRASPCDCGCNTPVATTPEGMLRFLASRFEHAGVAESVASIYARDIRKIIEEYYGPEKK